MPFDCPEAADFVNVGSLNQAFLRLIRADDGPRQCLATLTGPLAGKLSGLGERQIERLAMAPFLLFSIREDEDEFWELLIGGDRYPDLFHNADMIRDETRHVTAAAIGFLWQLARLNPFTARLVCGASLHWCELIAEQTICQLLSVVANRDDLLRLRFASDHMLWCKLLDSGTSRDKTARDAAHLTALRTVLSRTVQRRNNMWASAACRSEQPLLQTVGQRVTDNKHHR